jgi:hypothetical protein
MHMLASPEDIRSVRAIGKRQDSTLTGNVHSASSAPTQILCAEDNDSFARDVMQHSLPGFW